MSYSPGRAPAEYDPSWLDQEVRGLAEQANLADAIRLPTLHNEPARPRDGDVVLADGTNWNPGSGQGFYGYYAAAWHKLG